MGKFTEHRFQDGVELKHCNKCKQWLPLDSFTKNITAKDELEYRCISCNRQYRQNNKEKIAEQGKQSYEKNKEKIAKTIKK